ncbi:MAG: glycosyltransferase family 39 protein [Deltaproteobacteria bacterium]|nr:glycosyltransferase family 39 protein [Deltaproteobacteria bacterium]
MTPGTKTSAYLSRESISCACEGGPQPSLHPALTRLTRITLFIFLFTVILWALLLDLLPPTQRDALIHHLALPKIWLKQGILTDLPWASFSYYPMNLELLYLIPLALGADWGAKIIHHGFGLLTALIVYLYLKKRLNQNWAILGSVLFLSTPIVMRLSASAYVDLGLAFFITASWMAMLEWSSTRRNIFFIISAATLGLGLGTKYNALIALPLLTAGAMVLSAWNGKGFLKSGLWGLAFLFLALIMFSPWLIRNFVLTGNPLYPLYNHLWGLPGVAPSDLVVNIFTERHHLYGESLIQILLVPVRAFFSGQDHSPRFFDGVLNPILLILPVFALIKTRDRYLRLLGVFVLLWIIAVFFQSTFRIRYMLPILPVLVVLTVYGLHELWNFFSRRLTRGLSIVFFTCVLSSFLSLNVIWAYDFWQKAAPAPYLLGRETRETYLKKSLDHYEVMDFINRDLPSQSSILFLFAGNRGYYCDRNYFYHTFYSGETLKPILTGARSGLEIREELKSLGVTHILTRRALLTNYLVNNFQKDKLLIWRDFAKYYLKPRYRGRGYTLYEINDNHG